jgi:succinate dehydrogenase/fumarate reductase-like Fe-S protein
MIKLTINGQTQDVDVAGDTPLLWVLRDTLGLTGTKYGCGKALCGACTVHVDGAPTRACVTPAESVAGKSITTIEGLSSNRSHPVQQAWIEMELLPVRPDHGRRRAAQAEPETHGRRYRQCDVRQHLPLRNLSAHS